MYIKSKAVNVLEAARRKTGLSQRRLAERAGTTQSVVARIELGETDPRLATLARLLDAAGFELTLSMEPKPVLEAGLLDDVPRILRLSPEDRLREVANLNRFVAVARRG